MTSRAAADIEDALTRASRPRTTLPADAGWRRSQICWVCDQRRTCHPDRAHPDRLICRTCEALPGSPAQPSTEGQPAPMTAPVMTVEQLDPATLLTDKNLADRRPDADLTASIKADGVLIPLLAVRTADGQIRVRDGHCRTAAALQLGVPLVPVLVVADEGEGDKAEVERILAQYKVNKFRAPLTAADDARMVAQLFDFGLTADQVHKRTRLPKVAVEAARVVAASRAAAERAAASHMTLDMAAGLAEFDDDHEAFEVLARAAENGPGTFRHALQEQRDDRDSAAAKATVRAALEAAGITVADESPGYEHSLYIYAQPDGSMLTSEAHMDCPGNIAVLYQGLDDGKPAWHPTYYCADPKANGHRSRTAPDKPADPEAASAERKRVIAGNKAWNSALAVRQEWLRDRLLPQAKPPAGALRFVLESLARRDDAMTTVATGGAMGKLLLALPDAPRPESMARPNEILDAMAGASDQRLQVIALGMVLGAYEAALTMQTWRHPETEHAAARYLAALVSWGYIPAKIEKAVIDGTDWQPDGDGAAT